MMKNTSINRLATLLKAAGVDKETGLTISLRLHEEQKRALLIEWLETNSSATPLEICRKSRALAKS